MRICHIGTMGELKNYGSITRDIASKCKGEHIHADLYSSKLPEADIYLLHSFRNYKHLRAFRDFEHPAKGRVISLLHSSEPCMPALCSDVVVTISDTWRKRMREKYGIESQMIRGALDVALYADVEPDYAGFTFGRISRAEPGKFHRDWPQIVRNIKATVLGARYLLVCKDIKPSETGAADEQIVDIAIGDLTRKKEMLSHMSVFADMHDDRGLCEEVWGMAMLEAMASGLPIIALMDGQPGMLELCGDAIVPIAHAADYERYFKALLLSKAVKMERGAAARERAKQFDLNVMIEQWNDLFERMI